MYLLKSHRLKKNGLILAFLIASGYFADAHISAGFATDTLQSDFKNPPADCWPHTRWWWPGNPVSKEGITRELEEMRSHGIRGVEQITMGKVYEKGNIPYLSDEFMLMLKHTVSEARRLGMEVSLNFGGPGWIIGGEWVKEEDKSKDMVPTFIDIQGHQIYDGNLPDGLTKTRRSWEHYTPKLDGNEILLAVMAGRIEHDGKIDEKSLINLTANVVGNKLIWRIPEGEWRLMAFWLKKNGISNAVDHFSKGAMERYCDYVGNRFYNSFGDEFGKTVESLFADSFELPNLSSGINWSAGLLKDFRSEKGYDLTPYLPAIWWEIGDISPKIRFDVNDFLHKTGLRVFFKTFLAWCEDHNIKGRIQAYGFNTDNIEASGLTHIPVTFRVKNKVIRKWDPYTGEITPVLCFSDSDEGIIVPLNLAPYESMFVEFSHGEPEPYVTKTDFYQIIGTKNNEVRAYALQNGTYSASVKSDNSEKNISFTVTGIPAPFLISGKWKIELKGSEFPTFTRQSDFLFSWTDDPITRNFSGNDHYEINFNISSDYINKELKLFLDMGKVGNIAEVILNGKNIGTAWMRNQELDVTGVVKTGENKLLILVTNTLINRVSAMKEPPPVPGDLVSQFGNGAVITEIPGEFGFKPLPASGLMGPVKIVPLKVVTVNY